MNKNHLNSIKHQYIIMYADRLNISEEDFTDIINDINCIIRMAKLYRSKKHMWDPLLKHIAKALQSMCIHSDLLSDESIQTGKIYKLDDDFLYHCDFKYVMKSLFS